LNSAGEVQVLDFQTQQHKLFSALSMTYAIYFAQKMIIESYNTIYKEELAKGIYNSMPEVRYIT